MSGVEETPLTVSGRTEARRGETFEQFQWIHALGSAEDHDIPVPEVGVWGVRVYTRLRDLRGGSNEAFPATQYWASAGDPVYEHLRYADGSELEIGEGDTAGFLFQVRGVEGPDHYEMGDDVAYIWRGNWAG